MSGVDAFRWWNLNASVALYTSQLHIDFEGVDQRINQFRVDARLNNTFKLPLAFTIKWDVNYRSPMINAQQVRDGYFFSNIALRKGFLDNQLAVVVTGNNIFSTIKYNTTLQDTDFKVLTYYHEKPYVSLRVIFTFNNQQ